MISTPSRRFAFAAASLALGAAAPVARAQYFAGEWPADGNDRLGTALVIVGDLDGDGVPDFAVGSPRAETSAGHDAGKVQWFSGASHALLLLAEGTAAEGHFGAALAAVGDLDGDGIPDLAVGAPEVDPGSLPLAGRVVAIRGSDGTPLWTVDGALADGHFGEALAALPDLDGDGRGELLAGAPGSLDGAAAEVHALDADGAPLWTITAANPAGGFGRVLASVADLDQDGVADFVVGEPKEGSRLEGRARAFSTATQAELWSVDGARNAELPSALAPAADFDGDGIGDVLIGNDYYGGGMGRVEIVRGSTGALLRSVEGVIRAGYLGASVAMVGDWDQDGVDDYAAGLTGYRLNPAGGTERVEFYSGADGAPLYTLFAPALDSGIANDFGSVLAPAEFDGDGLPDLLVADPGYATADFDLAGNVELFRACPAFSAAYGSGWAGRKGVPTLIATQDAVVGDHVGLALGNSLGRPTEGLLLIGVESADLPTSAGGTLLVLTTQTLALPIPAAGATVSDTLPDDPALYFLDLYVQALELDPFASDGISFTPGLRLRCGYDL